jgi:hypothetical protein
LINSLSTPFNDRYAVKQYGGPLKHDALKYASNGRSVDLIGLAP